MSKIKGQHFRLFVGSGGVATANAVPEETNCSITIQANTEDTSSKDTEGLYNKETVVSTQWSAQVDSYQASPNQLRAILRMFNASEAVGVGFDQTTGATGTQNRVPAEANFAREGQALLNDVSMQFDDRTAVSVSLQFQGTGALSTVS